MSQTPAPAAPGALESLKTHAAAQLRRARPLARPAMGIAARHPRLLFGLGALGVVGVAAWMNRRKIARAATPAIDAGIEKCAQLYDRMPWMRSKEPTDVDPTLLH